MNRNHYKIIACICMLADHAGLLLFPGVAALRWIGRLAMPLFAFFIGEGCIHTSNRKRYAGSLLALGVFCQAFYIGEDLLVHRALHVGSDSWYFNILFTFFFAAVACYLFSDAKNAVLSKNRRRAVLRCGAFCLYFFSLCGLILAAYLLRRRGWSLYFDYGLCGVLLPLSVTLFSKKEAKLAAFSAGLLLYCFVYCREMPYVWFSLLTVPLLAVYNGKGGSKRLKYFFYVFYPAHLGILYLLAMLFA